MARFRSTLLKWTWPLFAAWLLLCAVMLFAGFMLALIPLIPITLLLAISMWS